MHLIDFDHSIIKNHPKGDDYRAWVGGLKNGDRVMVQEFKPGQGTSRFQLPFDLWTLSCATILNNNQLETSRDISPWNPVEGCLCYWGDVNRPWGKVFPARILKYVPNLFPVDGEEEPVYSHRPVYEPLYQGGFAHRYLVERDLDGVRTGYQKACDEVRRVYPYHKDEDTEDGTLFTCFSLNHEPVTLYGGASFLYHYRVAG